MTKKAILSISFGVTDPEMMRRNLDALERDYSALYPNYPVYRAVTNESVIAELRESDNNVYAVREVMARMVLDDVTDLYAQPAYILNGTENDELREMIFSHRADFNSVQCGVPLLTTHADFAGVCDALMENRNPGEEEAVVFVGHGSRHYSNTVYCALDYTFKDQGYPHAYVATFNAYPQIDTVIRHLRQDGIRKVTVEPFMFVAGTSAMEGVTGDSENSIRSILSEAGFEVAADSRCLGEYPKIRRIYTEHLKAIFEDHE